MKFATIFAGIVGMGLFAAATHAATTVYSNDFSTSAGPEWTDNSIATSNGESFLGSSANGFGNGTNTLTLSGLATHSLVTLSFDLYIIQSMDGNGPAGGGVDQWMLKAIGGSTMTLLDTNFANYTGGNTQSFGGPDGLGGYLTGGTYDPRTGADDAGHLGFGTGDFGDATYKLSFTFADTSSSLAFAFTSLQNQSPGDEGWGLDNVMVSTDADQFASPAAEVVPLPSAAWTGGLALLGMAGARLMRRRAAA